MTLPLRREQIPSIPFTHRYDHSSQFVPTAKETLILLTLLYAVTHGEAHGIPLRATITIEKGIVTIHYHIVSIPQSNRLTPRNKTPPRHKISPYQIQEENHIVKTTNDNTPLDPIINMKPTEHEAEAGTMIRS
mmetsp:Transcript_45129/g.54688  ORF Transcript_45129/g.54688 Transcript_45129/m.54688 type:complete len:133 (+) Transcript_45129:46-444(+)